MFNVANINLCTEVEGPFKRVAIWFQGCNRRCKGCCNKELQQIKPKHLLSIDELYNIIIDSKKNYNIEGVTFLGGEPTLQVELPLLAKKLRKTDIGTILFTGSIISDFDSSYIESFDLIIDGEFIIDNLDSKRNMIGSTNQKINLITNRYKDSLYWYTIKREKEIEINFSDNLYFNGDVFK